MTPARRSRIVFGDETTHLAADSRLLSPRSGDSRPCTRGRVTRREWLMRERERERRPRRRYRILISFHARYVARRLCAGQIALDTWRTHELLTRQEYQCHLPATELYTANRIQLSMPRVPLYKMAN